ncbi:class I adenylate-forming enzyme family protein [Halonatronum saccharophilum]|uniref:class I adenylate-forming enzyme family protein n=1 Tax=Halonatronum saccharophilum TaxID=150060 RepID=UPI0004846A9D|nr:class I adenylate-forming enzyme family protein [Halonatronum saccharophilum]
MSLWLQLYKSMQKYKDKKALTDSNGDDVSYSTLLKTIQSEAQRINELVPEGSKIAFLNTNSFYDAVSVLSILAAGCIAIPLFSNYGHGRCLKILEGVNPGLVLTNNKESLIEFDNFTTLNLDIDINYMSKQKEINLPMKTVSEKEVAMLMFTSGTTGYPKGVMLTHSNILSNLNSIKERFNLNQKDKILIVRPLYHISAMTGEFLLSLLNGAHIVFYDEEFSPRRLMRRLNDFEITIMCSTPTLFYNLALMKRNIELNHLKKIILSGECLKPKVAEKIIEDFPNVNLYNGYGLTEASPRISCLSPEEFHKKIGSVGKPLDNVKIKIIDQNDKEVSDEQIGELLVSGPNVMKGYYNLESLTKEKLREGWLHTGDLAYQDEEGYIYIVGRKDNMIIRAGVNIYPEEIENKLLECEEIKDIIIFGESTPKYGQNICAKIVPSEKNDINSAKIMELCRKNLEPYQWPSELEIVDDIKKNHSGKKIR